MNTLVDSRQDMSGKFVGGFMGGIVFGFIMAMMGMISSMTMMSLVGHIIYGALLGLGYVWYTSRR